MCKKDDSTSLEQKTIRSLINNYIQNEKTLINQLHFKIGHGTTIGGFREEIWRSMFEQIIPKKFVIERSVFIIDSEGKQSREVDLAIFDETYTPYIFHYGSIKFLPIEAVAVAIECKSTSFKQKDLKEWAQSIAQLKTSNDCCARTIPKIIYGKDGNSQTTQSATRPIRILCCLCDTSISEQLESGDNLFDFVIRATEKKTELTIEIDDTKHSLSDWYVELNHAQTDHEKKGEIASKNISKISIDDYKVYSGKKPVSLLTLNLQLNQLLMLINNPLLFPHMAYVNMFNNCVIEGQTDEK